MADAAPDWSPYRAYFDNPILFADPDGLFEQPKNWLQRAWNTVSGQGRYNRFQSFAKKVEELGGSVFNVDYHSKNGITYDISYTTSEPNPDYEPGNGQYPEEIGFNISKGWTFEPDYDNEENPKTFEGHYYSHLGVGEYNIFSGQVKGSGELEAPLIDPVDVASGGFTAFIRFGAAKTAATTAVNAETGLAKTGSISIHASTERMIERGVSKKMIEKAIAKGTKYYDPKNGTFNYVLRKGFASGKDLLVGTNTITGKVTTVIRGNNLVKKRFIPQ